MSQLEFDPAFSAGVRNLIANSSTAVARGSSRRRWVIGISLAGLSVLGTSGAVASNYLFPGEDSIAALGKPHTLQGTGPSSVNLDRAPNGTNSLEFTLTCEGGGTLIYPSGASQSCTDSKGTSSTDNMPWTIDDEVFRLNAASTAHWQLTYTFSRREPTALAVNEHGQTYGVDSARAHPELTAVEATNGRRGYINTEQDLKASCGDVHSPAEALKCNQEREGKAITLPVYLSDGVTQVGVFELR